MVKYNEEYSILDGGGYGEYCLECGTELPFGRPDRKFCSRECKNRWHNGHHTKTRNSKLRVAHVLEKNYRILSNLIVSGITSLPLTGLSFLGFNPLYSTCSYKAGHREMRMCFDIVYCLTPTKISDIAYVDTILSPREKA